MCLLCFCAMLLPLVVVLESGVWLVYIAGRAVSSSTNNDRVKWPCAVVAGQCGLCFIWINGSMACVELAAAREHCAE